MCVYITISFLQDSTGSQNVRCKQRSIHILVFFSWANKSRKSQKAGYPVFETSIRIVIAEGAQRAEKTVPVPGTPCLCSAPSLLKLPVIAYSSGLL